MRVFLRQKGPSQKEPPPPGTSFLWVNERGSVILRQVSTAKDIPLYVHASDSLVAMHHYEQLCPIGLAWADRTKAEVVFENDDEES